LASRQVPFFREIGPSVIVCAALLSKTPECSPEDIFPHGPLSGGATIGRATLEPGWRWSTSVQPNANTRSCEAPHFQYQVSGTLKVMMDDGTEFLCKPGDLSVLPSGHDAWVVGDETVVIVDFHGMKDYAKKAARQGSPDRRNPRGGRRGSSPAFRFSGRIDFTPHCQPQGLHSPGRQRSSEP
jgi:hypothetical protein